MEVLITVSLKVRNRFMLQPEDGYDCESRTVKRFRSAKSVIPLSLFENYF